MKTRKKVKNNLQTIECTDEQTNDFTYNWVTSSKLLPETSVTATSVFKYTADFPVKGAVLQKVSYKLNV